MRFSSLFEFTQNILALPATHWLGLSHLKANEVFEGVKWKMFKYHCWNMLYLCEQVDCYNCKPWSKSQRSSFWVRITQRIISQRFKILLGNKANVWDVWMSYLNMMPLDPAFHKWKRPALPPDFAVCEVGFSMHQSTGSWSRWAHEQPLTRLDWIRPGAAGMHRNGPRQVCVRTLDQVNRQAWGLPSLILCFTLPQGCRKQIWKHPLPFSFPNH